MKKKDLLTLRKKEIAELKKMVAEKKLESFKIHAEIKAGKEKNLRKFKNIRQDVAQLLTLIAEKGLFEQSKIKKEKEGK